jgi:digeranylgeranylglycerophospholipid reductase
VYDAIIAGGGPAGLSAAEALARRRCSVLILEQNHEIGSPIRTSGGSFVDELARLGIPENLYHPISRLRFTTPNNAAVFDYSPPVFCVMDVRGTFQVLAGRAIAAGAEIRLATAAVAPVLDGQRVTGVRTGKESLGCRVLIDATGYRGTLLKQAGLDPGFKRFGVGAEYDLYAPHWDQSEAVLAAGSRVAPAGYAWIFPWGHHRVRAGVGVIHPDSRAHPEAFLDAFIAAQPGLRGAQPVEHHAGLIPSEQFAATFTGDGILGVGDAAGHASSLVGEGIRWAIEAGRMAGDAAADAIHSGDVSRAGLMPFERRWKKRFGVNLRIANRVNQRIAGWTDLKWDERLEIVKMLTPAQFAEAMKTNLTGGWLLRFAASHPGLGLAALGISRRYSV